MASLAYHISDFKFNLSKFLIFVSRLLFMEIITCHIEFTVAFPTKRVAKNIEKFLNPRTTMPDRETFTLTKQ